jgi:hypothetical protein
MVGLRLVCWLLTSGRLFPSPGPGGNQTSGGGATGGGARGWCFLFSPVAPPPEARSGFACQARGTTDLEGNICAALGPPV